MNTEDEIEIRKIAEEHWKYVESICHKMYVDAFIHGFKHGSNEEFLLCPGSDFNGFSYQRWSFSGDTHDGFISGTCDSLGVGFFW